MNEINIKVLKPLGNSDFKEVYRNTVRLDINISFPYDSFVRVFSFLYPNCLIQIYQQL